MAGYTNDKASIGMSSVLMLFFREFEGKSAGKYRVWPVVVGGFYFKSCEAVMDDFGNLVAVEG